MRVSVFDPAPVVHQGLVQLLPGNGFSVVSQAFDGQNGREIVMQSKADLVITEILMEPVDGLQLLEQLSDLNVPKLVFTDRTNPTYVARAIANGADDVVFKFELESCLIHAMCGLTGNQSDKLVEIPDRNPAYRRIKQSLSAARYESSTEFSGARQNLTHRESQVLRHLGFGLSNREISLSLGISTETVKEHVQNILRKLDCHDRTQAAVWSVRNLEEDRV